MIIEIGLYLRLRCAICGRRINDECISRCGPKWYPISGDESIWLWQKEFEYKLH